jgi:DNA circularisation protein N-terminus
MAVMADLIPRSQNIRELLTRSRDAEVQQTEFRVAMPWRSRLRRASFKGVPFYVDQQGRTSGRRTVLFEYPKRDIPYAEDMGRLAMRYQITGYLIQAPRNPRGGRDVDTHWQDMDRDYDVARDKLEAVLNSPGPGRLVDPYNPRLTLPGYGTGNNGAFLFMCERYTIIESRERGGFCSLEMSFVEAGIPGNQDTDENTAAAVRQIALKMAAAAAEQLDEAQVKAGNTDIPDIGVLLAPK